MAQLKITTKQLRDYTRSLDERLEDRYKYPDSWIDSKINAAYEMLSTYRQSFYAEEVLDLNQYILDGTEKFPVTMDGDVLGYKRIFTNHNIHRLDPLDLKVLDANAITWNVMQDHTVEVMLDVNNLDPTTDNTITFQYYYIPTLAQEETFMSGDVYHMLRHAIQQTTWDALRDYEKANMAMQNFQESARTVINGLDIDSSYEGRCGGFIL